MFRYRYKGKYLEGNLIPYPLRKILVVVPHPKHYSLPRYSFLECILSCAGGFKFNQKSVTYFHNIHATIAPTGTSCEAGDYRSSQFHKTTDDCTFLSQKPKEHILAL